MPPDRDPAGDAATRSGGGCLQPWRGWGQFLRPRHSHGSFLCARELSVVYVEARSADRANMKVLVDKPHSIGRRARQ